MKRSQWKRKATVPMKRTPLRKVSLKKVKKPKIKSLKKKLDEVFSKYIRQKYADKEGYVQCYTCPKRLPVKEIQCGHFVSRAYLATRFDEDNCRPQCVGDNIFGGGRVAVFGSNLERELGQGTIERLFKKAQGITKDFPYEEKIKEYTEKLSTLQSLQ